MTTTACADLGPEGATASELMSALCTHNASLGFGKEGLACVTEEAGDVTASAGHVRNIGEGLAYSGGEELKWHHDGNQIHKWLEQRDVRANSFALPATAFILRAGLCVCHCAAGAL